MKAVQINQYGSVDVLEIINNCPEPSLKKGQVLIENYSASINAIDWKMRAGYLQKWAPLSLPVTLGGDFAGKISELGEGVFGFNVGDDVYGTASIINGGTGSFAQILAANSSNISFKPKTVNFEEAAALPLVGASSIQALEDHIKLQTAQKILIHGGAGGIGHIAIQLAKNLGAYVATTVKTKDRDFVKKLGADIIIDYKTQAFELILKNYDAVLDLVGGETTDKSFAVLKKSGILVTLAGMPNQQLAQKYGIIVIRQGTKTNTIHLNRLKQLVDTGKIKLHIDKIFPFEQIKEAFKYQEEIHPRGKIVIKIK